MSGAREKSDDVASPLLPGAQNSKPKAGSFSLKITVVGFAIILSTALAKGFSHFHDSGRELSTGVCPQVAELVPQKNGALWESLGSIYGTDKFKMRAVNWLGGAVRIPTESYDNMGPVGTDPRWEKFGALHDYLLASFPQVHSTLELTKVNTYGLIYVWKGSDTSIQPLLLAAHQDVVPVEPTTAKAWLHPPFSGYFDGEKVWGRGSLDDKSGLIGIMSSIETLLENNFQPRRTVVIASGFDEETSGLHGAQTLAPKLLEMFGEGGFAMLVDEGSGYGEQYGRVIATPGIGEKGYLDVLVEVASPGGHSSLPPPHTSIGILAELLVNYEKNPFEVHLTRGSPVYKTVQCLAQHAPDLPSALRKDILRAEHSDRALRAAEKKLFESRMLKSLAGTTQAIDLIQGGVKVNALPESVWAVINHRVSTESSIEATKARDTDLLRSLAVDFNLSYSAFGVGVSDTDAPAYGTLKLSEAYTHGLEPAPVTPTDESAVPWQLLSGTIKATYNSHRDIRGDDTVVISPGVMSGNTDTRYYWKLTEHIFRYGHQEGASGGALPSGVHTVNEAISIGNFVEIIRFFTTLILNVDESALP
ncbi:carboxypeptidase S [Leucogyrophana mollusca]|uniref:Carboxypeptidase S n=1 Tax=Leucogyrophana mollusca TaxID=85980 RepID=A0ACB8BT44_9AGAM|nr:carboxypeptidase S [Leucogyrophana mollusca]